eukprot:123370-Amphidinium_carterae.1
MCLPTAEPRAEDQANLWGQNGLECTREEHAKNIVQGGVKENEHHMIMVQGGTHMGCAKCGRMMKQRWASTLAHTACTGLPSGGQRRVVALAWTEWVNRADYRPDRPAP